MRFTWTNVTERGILVSNFGMTCKPLWTSHVGLVSACRCLPENRLRRRHVLKYATQLSCIRKLTFRWILSQFLITSLPRFPRSIVTRIWDRLSLLPISLFQHSHSTFCHYSFQTFSSAVRQPADVRMSTSPQNGNHSWSCRTRILEDAIFHRMSYCKFL